MWTIFFKVFIEFVTILLLFYVLVFWPRGIWDLSSRPGIEPTPPALEGEVLTTGLPGKSLSLQFYGWKLKCLPRDAKGISHLGMSSLLTPGFRKHVCSLLCSWCGIVLTYCCFKAFVLCLWTGIQICWWSVFLKVEDSILLVFLYVPYDMIKWLLRWLQSTHKAGN